MVRARANMIEFEVKKESIYMGKRPTLLYADCFICLLGTKGRQALP